MSAEADGSNVAMRGCCVKVGAGDFQPAASLVYYLEPVLAMLTVLDKLTYAISLFVGVWEKNFLQYPRKHKKPKNTGTIL